MIRFNKIEQRIIDKLINKEKLNIIEDTYYKYLKRYIENKEKTKDV